MRPDDPYDMDRMIFAIILVFSVIFISKIVFWLSICSLVAGAAWYAKARGTKQERTALFVIAVSLALLPITYFIGYRIEGIPMFNAVFDFLASLPSRL